MYDAVDICSKHANTFCHVVVVVIYGITFKIVYCIKIMVCQKEYTEIGGPWTRGPCFLLSCHEEHWSQFHL